MNAPPVKYVWHGNDGLHSDRSFAEEPFQREPHSSSFPQYTYDESYPLSPGNGSGGYPYLDEKIPLSTSDGQWSPNEGGDFTNGSLDMDRPGSFQDSFTMDNMRSALPNNSARSPPSFKLGTSPASKRNGTPCDYDTVDGDDIDDAFARAADDDTLGWIWGGRKRGSAKPSDANRCLRASERINERVAKWTPSKSARTTNSSSKSTHKSKGSHSSHNKKSSRK